MPVDDIPGYRGVIADEWFERAPRVPMTKNVTRSVLISLLSPLEGQFVLEVGSGTGAMTVELSRAAGRSGRVTSVEISLIAAGLTKRNLERASLLDRATVIHGKAPEHIPGETFDAVFIGGHGSELEAIIGACAERMNRGGRLALTSISPRTTDRSITFLENTGFRVGLWRLHSSCGHKTDGDWIILGNNPVDVIWGDR
ncbi:MAG: precorrin-6Y C5,15-methyltransferase (decarboxylating) subunit CbiT [Synergistaceae bacterium]|jgi:cobalt-precorrin-6B (C15)-methyltransferase|nr:precorrin-6Y C5,15-methyltransferase (decarboxylating) subunit CbiT [Synergistaceae bacterium]